MQTDTINIGILAHVDAGKTTLSEAILYGMGSIRRVGRVDHGDAFFDSNVLERERGITIFSKQAMAQIENIKYCLIDTPGHVDFSAEMERTLCVLDYAILVISGSEGIQGHTETVWRLLQKYQVPVFIFVNKMDREGTDKNIIIEQIQKKLSGNCLSFSNEFFIGEDKAPVFTKKLSEDIASSDEELLECYLEGEIQKTLPPNHDQTGSWLELVKEKIAAGKLFPCFFGSALQIIGVAEFIEGLHALVLPKDYPEAFQGKVFKILHDKQGDRITFLKVTGGRLKVKDTIDRIRGIGAGEAAEKIDQIRIYSGEKYQTVAGVCAGTICAVTGLENTHPGDGLGIDGSKGAPILRAMLITKLILPLGADIRHILKCMHMLGEEDPALHVIWDEYLKEIHLHIMGTIQIEILKKVVFERFGFEVEFGPCEILYRETIQAPVRGYGHFEPLRHYAEVQLELTPLPENSGIIIENQCKADVLDKNFQSLILTHIAEKEHRGILTGSPITDMKIILATGRAHVQHTAGGDFREATYRAIRQALEKAENLLLEPYYDFVIELPAEQIGRAMADVQRLAGNFDPPGIDGEIAVLTGAGPAVTFMDYPLELIAYTKGKGRVTFQQKGYAVCHNTEEVIAKIGYDKTRDMENPSSSVFCAQGAAILVKWDEVENMICS